MTHNNRKNTKKTSINYKYISVIIVLISTLIFSVVLFLNRSIDAKKVQTPSSIENKISSKTTRDEMKSSPNSILTSEDHSTTSSTSKTATIDETDSTKARIYDLELMDYLDVSFLEDPGSFESIDEVIQYVMEETDTDPSTVSITYYNFMDDSIYNLNETTPQIIASFYKVPLVAMYIDLINQGVYSYDTLVTVDEAAIEAAEEEGMMGEFPLDLLFEESIISSNNVSAWALIFHHFGGWPGYVEALGEFTDISEVSFLAFQENYLNSRIILDILLQIATNPAYDYLIDLMFDSTPHQLFTAFVQDGMANKYGSLDEIVNDAGIYYENGKPLYILVGLTHNTLYGDQFLELLNLRVNEWTRYHYIEQH